MSSLREIFVSFDADTSEASNKLGALNAKIDQITGVFSELSKALLGTFSLHGIESFISSQIELGSQLNDLSERLGISTDELQRFQFAAQLSGVSGEEAAKGLQFLNKNIGEAIGGQKQAVEQFASLGIQIKDQNGDVRELGDVIPEVADAFANMGSDQERTAAAMKLFGRSGASLIPLLKGGGEELKKMNKQFTDLGLGIDEDFIKKADEAGDKIDILKFGFRSLKSRIAVEILPTILNFASTFSKWIKTAKDIVNETNIVKEAWLATAGVGAIVAAKMALSWGKVLGLIPKGAGLFESLFSLGIAGLVIGALVLIAAAIEDIITMVQGGQSVLGEFFDTMGLSAEKQVLIDSLTKSWEQMQPALEQLGPIAQSVFQGFLKILPYVIAAVADLVQWILNSAVAVTKLGSGIADLVTGKRTGKQVFQDLADTGESFLKQKSTLGAVFNAKPNELPGGSAQFIGPPAPPGNASVNVENTFNINGAQDPEVTGRKVAGFQRDANQQAINDAAAALATGPQ